MVQVDGQRFVVFLHGDRRSVRERRGKLWRLLRLGRREMLRNGLGWDRMLLGWDAGWRGSDTGLGGKGN